MNRRLLSLCVVGALACASAVVAQTTGKLIGQVTDTSGSALPGVTISVSSSVLIGGTKADVTDAAGNYQFPLLPPGDYSVKAELASFIPQERSQVQVRLNRTTEINFQMALGEFSEEVEVVAETPVLDTQQVSTSQTFTDTYLANAAIGSTNRSYQSVLSQTAGVVGGSNPNVFGSTLGENAYIIDGIDSTDPVTATFGSNLNFDAIQEINFETGGFEAEFGRATGGVVSVITKSGGNEFSGTFDTRYRDTSFNENGDHFDRDANKTKFVNPSATLGGPIQKDKIWFFGAAEYTDSESTPTQSPTTRKYEGENYLGKVTWQFNPEWQSYAQFWSDPATIDNANASRFYTPDATRKQEQGGDTYHINVTGVPTPSLLVDLDVGVVRQQLNSFPQTGDLTKVGVNDVTTGENSQSYTNAQFSDRDRDDYNGSLTYFVDNMGGSHEFKGGVEYSNLGFKSHNYTTGNGFRLQTRSGGSPYLEWYEPDAGATKSDGTVTSAYLQDSWRIGQQLTAKIGVRYDAAEFSVNGISGKIADMSKVQPRIGLVYDITGDGKTLARASWGRFMHPSATTVPNFARINNLPGFRYVSCSRYYASIYGLDDPSQCSLLQGQENIGGVTVNDYLGADPYGIDPNGYLLFDVFSSEPNQVAKNLKPTYADELIVGIEREITRKTSIDLTYVNKKTKDIFEDTCNGNFPTPNANAACDYYLMYNIPGLERKYTGFILGFESRFADWLHIISSYTYSKSEGNVEYTQNAGADFDVYPDHYVNTYGYLSDDRRHRVKINGFVNLPLDFVIGFDGFWSSAFAYNDYAPADSYGDTFVVPRGSLRANDNWNLDLQVTKGFHVGDVRLAAIASIFNVVGNEQVTGVCENDGGCGSGINLGDPTTYAQPRHYEVGFRVEF